MRGKFDKNIICKKCGQRFQKKFFIDLGRRFKWKVFWQAVGIAFVLEFISNIIIYLIFKNL